MCWYSPRRSADLFSHELQQSAFEYYRCSSSDIYILILKCIFLLQVPLENIQNVLRCQFEPVIYACEDSTLFKMSGAGVFFHRFNMLALLLSIRVIVLSSPNPFVHYWTSL